MSDNTERPVCFLDVSQLLKFDATLSYLSKCPACNEVIGRHKDSIFQAQLLKEEDLEDIHIPQVEVGGEGDASSVAIRFAAMDSGEEREGSHPKKRARTVKPRLSVLEAMEEVQKGRLCAKLGCMSMPTCNFRGGYIAKYCFAHKEEEMVYIKKRFCVIDGCEKRAIYSNHGERRTHCREHCHSDMNSCTGCQSEGCTHIGRYQHPRNTETATLHPHRFCSQHKEEGMVNVAATSRNCNQEGCLKRKGYNFPGQKGLRFCATHKKEGMVDMRHKHCEHEGCTKRPHYNVEGEKTGRFCVTHRLPDMVGCGIFRHMLCITEGCTTSASFNHPPVKKRIHCSKHKEVGMVNVYQPGCREPGCKTVGSFNFLPHNTGVCCKKHKAEGMVNVILCCPKRKKKKEKVAT